MTNHEILDLNIDIVKAFLDGDFNKVQEMLNNVQLEAYVALASMTASFIASFSNNPLDELENVRGQLHAAID